MCQLLTSGHSLQVRTVVLSEQEQEQIAIQARQWQLWQLSFLLLYPNAGNDKQAAVEEEEGDQAHRQWKRLLNQIRGANMSPASTQLMMIMVEESG